MVVRPVGGPPDDVDRRVPFTSLAGMHCSARRDCSANPGEPKRPAMALDDQRLDRNDHGVDAGIERHGFRLEPGSRDIPCEVRRD